MDLCPPKSASERSSEQILSLAICISESLWTVVRRQLRKHIASESDSGIVSGASFDATVLSNAKNNGVLRCSEFFEQHSDDLVYNGINI